jgi:hypothetical protein
MMGKKERIVATGTMILAAAFAGLVVGCQHKSQSDNAGTQAKSTDPSKHVCAGQNSCKGLGGCKTSTHACKGKNACKGQGGCNTQFDPPSGSPGGSPSPK